MPKNPSRVYPALKDPEFGSKWLNLPDVQTLEMPPKKPVTSAKTFDTQAKEYCDSYEKFLYQYIAQHHLSPHSPYRGLLLFHGLGFGKTCTAITFAESWLESYSEQPIWVITSNALIDNFKGQLYRKNTRSQCLGDTYKALWKGIRNDTDDEETIHKLIERRYTFFTYERFGTLVAEKKDLAAWAQNRVIIVDEAHNLRNPTIRGALGLEAFLKAGNNNRLVLMTATPMFDRPDEIFQLMYYLALNDRRNDLGVSLEKLKQMSFYNKKDELQPNVLKVFKSLCSNYISYIKGKNPFLLAARLNPTVNGVALLKEPMKQGYFNTEAPMRPWVKDIPDGLVPTVLSSVQTDALTHHLFAKENAKQKMRRKMEDDDAVKIPINTNVLEATNVVYPDGKKYQVGSDGFQRIFQAKPIKGTSRLQYEYYDEPYLFPSDVYLKTYAAKLYRVAEMIQKASGIVMIYSHFIWSGVMPMAMVLEHLGYKPYQEEPYLHWKDRPLEGAALPKTPGRHYAIFCSDPTISGVDGFPKKLEAINDVKNANGENIKVILMSPVASEGISFENVREVHVLDPWYHLNRLEQVIGRSIRTCSHKNLPLEQRNVVVYLHVCQYPATSAKRDQETYDLYAYHLAADKKIKTGEIETVIRDHALDCSIQRSINYYPKDHFKFDLTMRTAQNAEIVLQFGDDPLMEPKCVAVKSAVKHTLGRKETYSALRLTAKERLRKYLFSKKKPVQSWDIAVLLDVIQLPHEIGLLGIADLIEELNRDATSPYRLVKHRQQLWVEQKPALNAPVHIHIQSFHAKETPKKVEDTKNGCVEIAEMLLNDENYSDYPEVTMVMFLTLLNVSCWTTIAERILRENIQSRLTKALWREGWLIAAEELNLTTTTRWIGYTMMDLWKNEKDFEVRLFLNGEWRDASRTEITRIQYGRVYSATPEPPYGFYINDLKTQSFKFKLLQDTAGKRVKTGIVATSLPTAQLHQMLETLNDRYLKRHGKALPVTPNFEGKKGKLNYTNRNYLASWVAYTMAFLKILQIPPYYKK